MNTQMLGFMLLIGLFATVAVSVLVTFSYNSFLIALGTIELIEVIMWLIAYGADK